MTQGPEYKTKGKRPVWLKDGDEWEATQNNGPSFKGRDLDYFWSTINSIRLPADHWANAAIEAGLEPWAGGDEAPKDWDGGGVLLRAGYVGSGRIWNCEGTGTDIIGYKKKESVVSELPKDVTALVIAARRVWDDIDFITGDSAEWHKLDEALEAFSSRVPYEDEPEQSAVSEEVQDWAIEAALKDLNYGGTTLKLVKIYPDEHYEVFVLARMIQKHETHRKPKDRDEEVADKWARKIISSPNNFFVYEQVLYAIKEAKS